MLDREKVLEWIEHNSWTGDSENNAEDEVLVVDADDLHLAITNGDFDVKEDLK